MSNLYHWDDLHPITRASIEAQPLNTGTVDEGLPTCGCYQPPQAIGKWYICSYHEGMEVGIEKVAELIETGWVR